MEFLYLSWDKAAQLCEQLSERIDFVPDMLVGISRGGLVPVRILSDKMGVSEIGILGIGFYKSVNQTFEFPRITQELSKDVEGKKVLVVDDSAVVRQILSRELDRNPDIEVVGTAVSGEGLLARLDEWRPRVILQDLLLPGGMDGIDVLREIKNRQPTAEVILLTGHASIETSIEGMKLGAFDYLLKPIRFDELLDKLSAAFKKKTSLSRPSN